MPEMSDHCPFLNRSDARCSEFFNLDHLQHAFKFCFDRYATCPVYAEQLAERQGRRQAAAAGAGGAGRQVLVSLSIPSRYTQSQHAA